MAMKELRTLHAYILQSSIRRATPGSSHCSSRFEENCTTFGIAALNTATVTGTTKDESPREAKGARNTVDPYHQRRRASDKANMTRKNTRVAMKAKINRNVAASALERDSLLVSASR